MKKGINIKEVFIKRINKFQNSIDFTDFVNCLNIVEYDLVSKDNQVTYIYIYIMNIYNLYTLDRKNLYIFWQ